MRCIIQRVLRASVEVDGKIISEIGPGLLALVGIGVDDTEEDSNRLTRKLLRARLFMSDDDKHWNKNVMEKNYE